jgi:hypothetical protein
MYKLSDVFIAALIMVTVLGVAALVSYIPSHFACTRTAEGLKLTADYSFINGCRFRVGDRLVPQSMIRITSDGNVLIQAE